MLRVEQRSFHVEKGKDNRVYALAGVFTFFVAISIA